MKYQDTPDTKPVLVRWPGIVEAQRHLTVRDMLDGIGGTLPAMAAMRFALGSFFVLSGFHKLTNRERHKTFVETLKLVC